MNDLI